MVENDALLTHEAETEGDVSFGESQHLQFAEIEKLKKVFDGP